MELIISAISQGILWGILSLGLFISFRILNIADMTTEGCYPLGAAVCVVAIQQGIHPVMAILFAMIAGAMAGAITGFLMTVCKIPSLLAGILTMTALMSVNLKVMQRPNLSLLHYETIFSYLAQFNLPKYYDVLLVGMIIVALLIVIMVWFFNTELGQALIATGDNPKMAISLGISTNKMMVFGLMVSNSLIALSGAVLAQYNGFSDVNSGIGTIVIALAAIIIGEVVFLDVSFTERLICIVYGSIIYRLLVVLVLKLEIISPNDFKLFSAIMVAICLSIPQIKKGFTLISKHQGDE